jgi:hypothetical protein
MVDNVLRDINNLERRPKVVLSSLGSNFLRVVNPFMPMWWDMAMPGAEPLSQLRKKGLLDSAPS